MAGSRNDIKKLYIDAKITWAILITISISIYEHDSKIATYMYIVGRGAQTFDIYA